LFLRTVSSGPDICEEGVMKRIGTWAGMGLLLVASLVFGVRASICCIGEAGNERWLLLGLVFPVALVGLGFASTYLVTRLADARAKRRPRPSAAAIRLEHAR
jgi:ABC-type uncharacterized transport system permease subunit